MRWLSVPLAVLFGTLSFILGTPAGAIVTVGATSGMELVQAVEVEGNIAYVAGQREYHWPRSIYGLQIVDVSDPRMPRELSFYKTYDAREVAVEDGLAYLAEGYGGLRIIDVTDPASPAELGLLDTPGAAADIKVVGGLAYLADGYSGFRIIDVSDPTLPREMGVFETGGAAKDVEIVGSVAYVAVSSGSGWLQAIDISIPSTPVALGRINTPPRYLFDVEVVDSHAYVTGDGFIQVIDVSDPAALKQIGGVALSGRGEDIEISGGRAYLAAYTEGLLVFDVSNPATPVSIGRMDTPGSAMDIELAGNLIFVADVPYMNADGSVRIIDASNAVVPATLGEIFAGSSPRDLEIVDELAYVASSGWGPYLRVFDVSNPSQPFEIGATEDGGARAVTVNGTFAYVLSYRDLRIIDISNPSFPSEVALLEIARDLQDVEVAAGVAYVAAYSSGLRIIDVSNPTDPTEIAVLEIPRSTRDVEIVGSIAYVAGGEGLLVIDVSNPRQPILIGSIRTASRRPLGVAVSGNYAYVADTFGLEIFDVSNPAQLTLLGNLPALNDYWDVEVSEGVAYLAADNSGVRAVDVSLPEWPLELGALGFDIYKDFVGVEVHDGLVYAVTEIGSHLYIIEFGPEYVTEVAVGVDIKPGSESNPINFSIEGVIPVAILGSAEWDVANVEQTTLAFGPGGAPPAHCHGPHLEDVNGDGYQDLLSHFRTDETGITFGGRMACLSGETLDGLRLRGCDSVRTVPDMDGDGLLDVDEAAIGTHALDPDTDEDGFEDGEEVLLMGTDPLNAYDPAPVEKSKRRGRRRR